MTYIKFSNGSTTKLINMYNEQLQREAEEDGFHMMLDKEGVPVTIDSSSLTVNKMDDSRAQLIKKIETKKTTK